MLLGFPVTFSGFYSKVCVWMSNLKYPRSITATHTFSHMKSYCASILSIILFTSLSVINAQTDSASFGNSDQLIGKANELSDQGDYAGAILLLNRVGICDPQYPRACYELALNLYNVGQQTWPWPNAGKPNILSTTSPTSTAL
jgi:hypothetical protein